MSGANNALLRMDYSVFVLSVLILSPRYGYGKNKALRKDAHVRFDSLHKLQEGLR